jgi:hypothetical protein
MAYEVTNLPKLYKKGDTDMHDRPLTAKEIKSGNELMQVIIDRHNACNHKIEPLKIGEHYIGLTCKKCNSNFREVK